MADRTKKPSGGLLQDTRTETELEVKKPSLYHVILLNDDFTPQEFVVWVLVMVFHKNAGESNRIMLEAHSRGRAIIGTYTHDIARTRVMRVLDLARKHEHPLECVIEAAAAA